MRDEEWKEQEKQDEKESEFERQTDEQETDWKHWRFTNRWLQRCF